MSSGIDIVVCAHAAADHGFWTTEDTLARARKILNGAKARTGATWREIFEFCDSDRTGELEWREFMSLVRDILRIPPRALSNHDLRALFDAINVDGGDGVDPVELSQYIEHGTVSDAHKQARLKLRRRRVQKALLLASHRISCERADVQHLFAAVDLDASNRLSLDEFSHWVRTELRLSRWDISKAELGEIYQKIDKNGDGVCVNEFWSYLREKEQNRMRLGPQNFHDPGQHRPERRIKVRTLRERLLREAAPNAVSLPQLSPAFTSEGRTKAPITRSLGMLPRLS
mmetsp:Transcript_145/g.213  ORF Transcript_145/g.213 Transcript_145/m.213 type:complete len:286 (+) Transcript_145:60-917(+)